MNLEIRSQLKTYWKHILAISMLAIALLGSAVWGMSFPGVDDYQLFSDPVDVLGGELYIGLYSQLGLLLWAACAGICFFTASILKRKGHKKGFRRYLISSGVLCALLCLDDTFLLHEHVPEFFNIQESVVFYVYILIVLGFYMAFYRTIRQTPYVFLGVTAILFFFSVVSDFFATLFISNAYLIEEFPKLAGLVFLVTYFYQTGLSSMAPESEAENFK